MFCRFTILLRKVYRRQQRTFGFTRGSPRPVQVPWRHWASSVKYRNRWKTQMELWKHKNYSSFPQDGGTKIVEVQLILRGHRKSSQKLSKTNKTSFTWNPFLPPRNEQKFALQPQVSSLRPMCIQNTTDLTPKVRFFRNSENPHPPKHILVVSLLRWPLSKPDNSSKICPRKSEQLSFLWIHAVLCIVLGLRSG